MAITTKDFTTLVQDSVTAVQGFARNLVDLTVGSTLLAIIEANSMIVLWLQGLILQLLATTRAATSNDGDLDSFMADYGFVRLPANAATGLVTFSRYTATTQALVPVGATVLTADGTQSYLVTADASNLAYNAALSGYVVNIGVASVTVPVQAVNAGIQANAQAGQISLISQPIPGIDTVANPAGFANGIDSESDPAFRLRFIGYLASLSKATKQSIGYVLQSLQQGVIYSLTENMDYQGNSKPGYFYAVVDDGSGNPSDAFLNSAAAAIETARPFTVTYGTFRPVIIPANVAMTITTAPGYDHSATAAAVQAAVQTYINALSQGGTLAYTRLSQIAYDASEGVANVTGITLNGSTADITATSQQTIKSGTVSIA